MDWISGTHSASRGRVWESTSSTMRLGRKRAYECVHQGFGIGAAALADEDDLARLGQVEFGRRQHLRQGHGRGAQARREAGQQALGRFAEVGAVGELGQAQQIGKRHGIAGGLGAVVILLDAHHQVRIPGRGAEESAVLGVFEQLALLFGEADGRFEMAEIELRFVEIEERLGEQRVIVEEAGDGGVALRGSGAAAGPCRNRTNDSRMNSAARRAAAA